MPSEGARSIRLVTAVPGPRSSAIAARRDVAGARGAARLTDVAIVSGSGALVEDADGNRLLDLAGGIGSLAVGHAPHTVVTALRDQAEKLIHMCGIVASYEPQVALLERLVDIAPGSFLKKAVLLNSGAEAIETCVKVARAYTRRQAIVVFEGGYHGRTNLTLGMTSKYGLFKTGFGPFPSEIYRLPFPNVYRRPAGMSEEAFVEASIAALRTAMVAQVDPAAIAAFVIEPVQGEGGFVPVPKAFLQELRDIATANGIVLVADEVQTGMGRTGTLWAVGQYGIEPDLIATAKSLGAGMPIAAVVGRAEVMDGPHPGGLGGTFSGNPLACAAALAAIDMITEPTFLARAREVGERLRVKLEELAALHPAIGDVRGLGPMLAVEFVKDEAKTPWPELVLDVTKRALARGVIVIRAGLYSNCLRFLPPLTITDEQIDEGLEVIGAALRDALRDTLSATPSATLAAGSAASFGAAPGREDTPVPADGSLTHA
jgi:4-aminobutyrate aminotransferase/(S)-3-amino-2-methylpropionate transaminase